MGRKLIQRIAEIFPSQEIQRITNITPKRPTPRSIIIKLPKVKDKERILKARRKITCYIQDTP